MDPELPLEEAWEEDQNASSKRLCHMYKVDTMRKRLPTGEWEDFLYAKNDGFMGKLSRRN